MSIPYSAIDRDNIHYGIFLNELKIKQDFFQDLIESLIGEQRWDILTALSGTETVSRIKKELNQL